MGSFMMAFLNSHLLMLEVDTVVHLCHLYSPYGDRPTSTSMHNSFNGGGRIVFQDFQEESKDPKGQVEAQRSRRYSSAGTPTSKNRRPRSRSSDILYATTQAAWRRCIPGSAVHRAHYVSSWKPTCKENTDARPRGGCAIG